MTSERPFSQACENNKGYILDKLATIVKPEDRVLEVGSGTAQHARHFSEHLPFIQWQPSEIRSNTATLEAGLADHGLENLQDPLIAEAGYGWPESAFDGVYSANCLHIMSAACVEQFMAAMNSLVKPGGFLCVYGPFRYSGEFTTPSNARFDEWLKGRDPLGGIRNFEWVNSLAEESGFKLVADHALPANNQFIHWQKAL